MPDNDQGDQVNLNFLGQAVRFVWGVGGGAIKNMTNLYVIFAMCLLLFSLLISPYLTFAVFLGISIWIFKFYSRTIKEHPDLFQEGKIWLASQKALFGSKGSPMRELPLNTKLLQPVSQATTSPSKARTIEVKT